MSNHLVGVLLRAAKDHSANTSDHHDSQGADHGADDHGSDDHGGSHQWWSNSSELIFTSDATLIPMIVLCVTFEWIHHKLMHWCTHADPATGHPQSKEDAKLQKKIFKIRRYLEPWVLPTVSGPSTDSNELYKGFESGRVRRGTDHPFRGSQLQPLMNRMSSEFMVLGFIALTIWVARTAGLFEAVVENMGEDAGPTTEHDLVVVAEEVHVALFVSMVLYFGIIFLTVRHLEDVMMCYGDMEKEERAAMLVEHRGGVGLQSVMSRVRAGETDRVQLKAANKNLRNANPNASPLGHRSSRDWKVRHMVQYDNMRKFFLDYVRAFGPDIGIIGLHDNFDFSCYLRVGLDVYMKDLVTVHATTWIIVLLLYAIECVVAAVGGLEGKILYVNVGLTIGYNAIGLLVVYLIRLRFGKRLELESESKTSWITKFAALLPPNAEIYVLRLFQALVMFTSFSLAKFIVAKTSYHDGGEEVPNWVNWVIKITFLLMLTLLLRHLVPSLNMLLRLPPFLDEHEAEIIVLIHENQSVDMGQLMRNAVKARERGDAEEAENWEQEVQNEVIANLERQHSRISVGGIDLAALEPITRQSTRMSNASDLASTSDTRPDRNLANPAALPTRPSFLFGRSPERMVSFHFPRVKERALSTQDLFAAPPSASFPPDALPPERVGSEGSRSGATNPPLVHAVSKGKVEHVGHGEVVVHSTHRLSGPIVASRKTPGANAESVTAWDDGPTPVEPAQDTCQRDHLIADRAVTCLPSAPRATPPSPPRGSPLKAIPAAMARPTSSKIKLAPLPQPSTRSGKTWYDAGDSKRHMTERAPDSAQVPGVPDVSAADDDDDRPAGALKGGTY